MDITTSILDTYQSSNIPELRSGSSQEQLKEVAQEFEALFVKMMLDAMLDSRTQENNLAYGGMAEDIFEDMLYTEYSRTIAGSGDFAIADMIINQFSSDRQQSESLN